MCVQYWPAGKNREEIYSGVGVTVENEEQLANFMIRTIRMRKVSIAFEKNQFLFLTPCMHFWIKQLDLRNAICNLISTQKKTVDTVFQI